MEMMVRLYWIKLYLKKKIRSESDLVPGQRSQTPTLEEVIEQNVTSVGSLQLATCVHTTQDKHEIRKQLDG